MVSNISSTKYKIILKLSTIPFVSKFLLLREYVQLHEEVFLPMEIQDITGLHLS